VKNMHKRSETLKGLAQLWGLRNDKDKYPLKRGGGGKNGGPISTTYVTLKVR
jgi:hypothetical protein